MGANAPSPHSGAYYNHVEWRLEKPVLIYHSSLMIHIPMVMCSPGKVWSDNRDVPCDGLLARLTVSDKNAHKPSVAVSILEEKRFLTQQQLLQKKTFKML